MSKNNRNSERRMDKRLEVELPLEIGGTDFKVGTVAQNISSSGIYCQVDRFVPVMTKLGLELTIPLIENKRKIEKKFNCEAVVVRIKPKPSIESGKAYQLGLFFVDIKDKNRQIINRYLQNAFFANNS